MKTAYELAMERLQQQAPDRTLTADQKAALVEIESRYRARIAEQEIRYGDDIQEAASAGDHSRVDRLREELSRVVRKLEEERDDRKEAVRKGQP